VADEQEPLSPRVMRERGRDIRPPHVGRRSRVALDNALQTGVQLLGVTVAAKI
jgi:hypothetical protein